MGNSRLAVENVAVLVFVLFHHFGPEILCFGLGLDFFPHWPCDKRQDSCSDGKIASLLTGIGIFDERNVMKVPRIRNAKCPHAVGVSRFLEMPIERLPAHVDIVAAYFAGIFDAKTMQFVKPVRDRFAIPAKRKLQRVVDLLLGFLLLLLDLDVLNVLELDNQSGVNAKRKR